MASVEIFGFAPSTYTRTARMACIEKGVAHTLLPLAFGEDSHRALHPFLKMPAMRHGACLLYETLAICDYIDEAFPGSALKPAATADRARMFGWVTAQIDYLYPALIHGLVADTPPTETEQAAARTRLEIFDRALTQAAWLVGNGISLADLFLAPMIAFAGQHPVGHNILVGLTGIADWQGRMADRPSFRETAT